MRSLSRTLAVRFSLTLAATLLGVVVWAYLGVRRTVEAELDDALWAAAQLQYDALAAGRPPARHVAPPDAARPTREFNRLVAVRDRTGRIVAANAPQAWHLPLDTADFHGARSAGHPVWNTRPGRRGAVRSVYLTAPAGNPLDAAVVQVSGALGPANDAARRMLPRLLAVVGVGSVATLLGAGWLARSSVAPVAAIAAQARSLRAGAVGQRITVHGEVSEYAALVQVLNELLARLDQALLHQQRLIADLAHELRTPLTAMRAGVELALLSPRSPDQYRAVLASVLEEIDRLSAAGEALLLLTRHDAGELRADFAPIDLHQLAHEAVRRAEARRSGHRFRLWPERDAPPVQGDAALLAAALDRLLDNAIRHTPAGTGVDLRLVAGGAEVALVVEDDGPGVPAELLPRLFDRFFRGDPARTRAAGPGLGLSVAAAIAQAHHGRIYAERGERGGLRVTVALPAHASAARLSGAASSLP